MERNAQTRLGSYGEHCRSRLVDEYAPAVPLGAAFNVILAFFCFRADDPRAASILLAIGAAFALSYPLSRTAALRARPELGILIIGVLCAVGSATLTGVGNGFEATGWAILLVCWGLGATQLSLSVPVLAGGIGMQVAVFCGVLAARGALERTNGLIIGAVMASGAALAIFGARERHRREQKLFVEEELLLEREAELRREERALSARRAELELVARQQVQELLAGARTVGALESLLGERVSNRSRRLAAGVDQAWSMPPHKRDSEPDSGGHRP
ncbi:MAG: hypothetical protein JNL21_22005 [Myxococcales bacterium]|nr:hypothetical protein [Myxococcales bacterium]